MNSKIDYDFIKEFLESGEIKEMAEQMGVPTGSAYKILAGKMKNFAFVEACYKKALERASNFKAMKESLGTLKQHIASL